MPLMNINFVIASENTKELSDFYAKISSDKANKGFNATHYFISLSNRSKIHFLDLIKITNGKGKETQPHCVFNVNHARIHQQS